MKDKYAPQIKALKAAAGFVVKGERRTCEGVAHCPKASLKKYGVIEFEVATRVIKEGQFLVFAGKA